MSDSSSSIHAFLGNSVAKSSIHAYTYYSLTYRASVSAYTTSYSDPQKSSVGAYVASRVAASSTKSAYMPGASSTATSRKAAYIGMAVVRSSISVRFGGDGTGAIVAERAYLELETSDLGVKKRFRVIAQGYDDGMLTKAETLARTIGGGVDHSVGSSYREWNPVIRVRHTEEDTSYGTLAELEYFYELNNPGGTPSNDITLYDHHNQTYTIHLVGQFKKQLMGCQTEGTTAWYLVSLKMVEV